VTTIQKENKKITKHNFQNNLILKDKIKKKIGWWRVKLRIKKAKTKTH
jgi:hypothetical protein